MSFGMEKLLTHWWIYSSVLCFISIFQLNELDLMYYVQVNDPKTFSIRNFNQKLMEDKRVSISMVGYSNFFYLYLLHFQINSVELIYNILTLLESPGTYWRWDDNLSKKMTIFENLFGKFYASELISPFWCTASV